MTAARGLLRRWLTELRAAPSASDAEAAIARLDVRMGESDPELVELVGGGVAVGDAVAEIRERERERVGVSQVGAMGEVEVVAIARGIYARVPTAVGRVRLLEMARRAARKAVVVHVAVTDDKSHAGRIVFDVPRAALRAAGVRVAEPGDRFGPGDYAHCFFDEEALLREVARAGLAVTKRRGFTFVLRDAAHASGLDEDADPFAIEVGRVARLVRAVDDGRASMSPQQILAAMRERGAKAKERGLIGRARLRRAIGWIDALLAFSLTPGTPGGPSCYRRILLEVALDAGAARETVVFGLDVGSTGHVAFENREERSFDVSFAIPAEATRS